MNRNRRRIYWGLLILAALFLPGADVECDWEDGEFEFNLPSFGHGHDHDDYYYEEWYYEEDYYGCDFWCW